MRFCLQNVGLEMSSVANARVKRKKIKPQKYIKKGTEAELAARGVSGRSHPFALCSKA